MEKIKLKDTIGTVKPDKHSEITAQHVKLDN